jgi:signal transduction histidine kinase
MPQPAPDDPLSPTEPARIEQIAAIAHELNNLLATIRGYADLARDGLAEDDPARADLDQVIRAADRAATLTGRLLSARRE